MDKNHMISEHSLVLNLKEKQLQNKRGNLQS